MTFNVSPTPVQRFVDTSTGAALVGGLLYTYLAGTTTPSATYTDSTGTTPNTNPIVLNSRGEAPVWLDPALTYKFVLKTSAGVSIWTQDNLVGAQSSLSLSGASGSSLIGFLPAGAGGVLRSVQSKLRDIVSLLDFGPHDDGVTSDSAALTAANAGGTELLIPAGNYAVGSNVTFSVPVHMALGAKLIIPNGVTLTFNAGFSAPLSQVFSCSGTGAVAFGSASTPIAAPEWWGAVAGSSGTDSSAAINACIVAAPFTQLQLGDYYIGTSTVKLNTAGRTLRGQGGAGSTTGQVTRIISQSPTATIVQCGPDSAPANIGLYPEGMTLEDLCVTRSTAPTAAAATTGAHGVKAQWTLSLALTRVRSYDSCNGFFISATVVTRIERCAAYRTLAATNPGGDFFNGFYLYGQSGLGLAGGNASTYLHQCMVNCTVAALTSVGSAGFNLATAAADTFIASCEVASCSQGLQLFGSSGLSPTLQKSGDADIHITDLIVDGFTQWGIYITQLSNNAAVDLKGCYFAPASVSATGGIGVQNSSGIVTSANNQVIGWPSTTCAGIKLDSVVNFSSRGDMLVDCAVPVVLTACQACVIEPIINNINQGVSSRGAVQLNSSSNRCQIRPTINGGGGVGVITCGVELVGSTNSSNEINCTAIVPSALTGGLSANKLLINGAQITSTGLSGGNLVSGAMT